MLTVVWMCWNWTEQLLHFRHCVALYLANGSKQLWQKKASSLMMTVVAVVWFDGALRGHGRKKNMFPCKGLHSLAKFSIPLQRLYSLAIFFFFNAHWCTSASAWLMSTLMHSWLRDDITLGAEIIWRRTWNASCGQYMSLTWGNAKRCEGTQSFFSPFHAPFRGSVGFWV